MQTEYLVAVGLQRPPPRDCQNAQAEDEAESSKGAPIMIVTVVTPTLNAIEYLAECIESVKRNNSALVEVEHVIVDGGSSDGTVELAQKNGLRILTGKDRGIF